jgi:hypothetical protein
MSETLQRIVSLIGDRKLRVSAHRECLFIWFGAFQQALKRLPFW